MTRILCLGMSALDAIYRVPAIPTTPTKILATGFIESGGGMAANASVAIARLDAHVHYWGRLGDDALGERILAELAREGVDVGRSAGCRIALRQARRSSSATTASGCICIYNDPRLDPDPGWLPLDEVREFRRRPHRRPLAGGCGAGARRRARAPAIAVFDGDVGPPDALLDLARRATHVAFSEPGLERASGADQPPARVCGGWRR